MTLTTQLMRSLKNIPSTDSFRIEYSETLLREASDIPNFWEDFYLALENALKNHPSLHTLEIHVDHPIMDVEHLPTVLKNSLPSLKHLKLSSEGTFNADILFPYLNNHTLLSLTLERVKLFSADSWNRLVELLEQQTQLQSLSIKLFDAAPVGTASTFVTHALPKMPNLHTLELQSIFDFADNAMILHALTPNNRIHTLNLSHHSCSIWVQNPFVTDSPDYHDFLLMIDAVILFLNHNTSIRHFFLQGLCLGTEFSRLAQSLAHHRELLTFDVSNNFLDDKQLGNVKTLLEKMPRLQHFIFAANQLSPHGLGQFAMMLEELLHQQPAYPLRTLDLNNAVSKNGSVDIERRHLIANGITHLLRLASRFPLEVLDFNRIVRAGKHLSYDDPNMVTQWVNAMSFSHTLLTLHFSDMYDHQFKPYLMRNQLIKKNIDKVHALMEGAVSDVSVSKKRKRQIKKMETMSEEFELALKEMREILKLPEIKFTSQYPLLQDYERLLEGMLCFHISDYRGAYELLSQPFSSHISQQHADAVLLQIMFILQSKVLETEKNNQFLKLCAQWSIYLTSVTKDTCLDLLVCLEKAHTKQFEKYKELLESPYWLTPDEIKMFAQQALQVENLPHCEKLLLRHYAEEPITYATDIKYLFYSEAFHQVLKTWQAEKEVALVLFAGQCLQETFELSWQPRKITYDLLRQLAFSRRNLNNLRENMSRQWFEYSQRHRLFSETVQSDYDGDESVKIKPKLN